MEKAVAMALEKMADARALSHSRAVQRNVSSLLTKKVGLHRLRRRGHNSAMASQCRRSTTAQGSEAAIRVSALRSS